MPNFRYKAVTAAGEVVEGEMEANASAAVVDWLEDLGHLPVRAEQVDAHAPKNWLARDVFGGRRVTRKALVGITRELATLLGAGLPLERSLEILIDLGKDQGIRELLARVLGDVRGGSSLADALEARDRTFSPLYVSLVRAGEISGALEAVLARLADHLEKSQRVAESVRSALIYPAVLVVMAGLSIVVLLTLVVPEFKPLFEDAGNALPLTTRIIIASGEAFSEYWWLMAVSVVASVLLLRRKLADPSFRYLVDDLILRLPLLGELVKKVQTARFARTFGTLTQNGVTLLQALSIVRQTIDNSVLARAVDGVAARLREGEGLAEPLAATGVFPDLAVQLVRVGEETGELNDMLMRVADIYDREVQMAIDRMISLLVPALTIGLGLIIAGIIGSVLSALLSVNELAF